MPAKRLNLNLSSVEKFWLCARESQSRFIVHVGLSAKDQKVKKGDTIEWIHMRPPFEFSDCKIDLFGSIQLTEEEREIIEIFCERYSNEINGISPENQYIIYPCQLPKSTLIPYRRFSCVGFVLYTYKKAGFVLFVEDRVPNREIDFLRKHYPGNFWNDPHKREKFGLSGSGPWPVVLPGYVINAFDRPYEEIRTTPFQPQVEHAFFPSDEMPSSSTLERTI